jgi:hypothetical protein
VNAAKSDHQTLGIVLVPLGVLTAIGGLILLENRRAEDEGRVGPLRTDASEPYAVLAVEREENP